MDAKKLAAISTVKKLMEGDNLSSVLNEIKHDIALNIVRTSIDQKAEREELYMLTKAIDVLQVKLQEYVNYETNQENN